MPLDDPHIFLDPVIGEVETNFCLFPFDWEAYILVVGRGIFFLQEIHVGQHELFFGIVTLVLFQVEFCNSLVEFRVLESVLAFVLH